MACFGVKIGKKGTSTMRLKIRFSGILRHHMTLASDRYGFFRHLQITIIGRFRFADISANADNLQIHIFIGRCGNISADSRGYLQIFEDI